MFGGDCFDQFASDFDDNVTTLVAIVIMLTTQIDHSEFPNLEP